MDSGHSIVKIPDVRHHLIDDDTTAHAIAVFYGLAGQLGKAALPATEESALVDDHPTHWLLIVRFWGNLDPAENGWNVLAMRKSDFSRDEAERKRAEFHGGTDHFGVRITGGDHRGN